MSQSAKMEWKFQPITDDEKRKATALEFIAYYLDRIDGHLEKLAASAVAGNHHSANIAMELTSIAALVQNKS